MRMRLVFVLIFSVIIVIYTLINYYIGIRGWRSLGASIPHLNKVAYWSVFWLIALSYILARLVAGFLPGYIGKGLTLLGSYWMAAMLYFIIFLVLIDLIRLVNRWTGFIPLSFRQSVWVLGLIVFLGVIGILVYGTWNANNPIIKHYDISISKKTGTLEKLNIAMVSDIHLGDIVNKSRLAKMVDMINGLNPDIILTPGDIIDEDIGPVLEQNMSDEFKRLKSKFGVYAALGNHEYYGGHLEEIVKYLQDSGIQVLRDRYVKVNDSLIIAGREDKDVKRMAGRERKPLSEVLSGADRNLPVIMMDHRPVDLKEAQEQGVDLQLSGHTHRGQMFPNQWITKRTFEVDWGYLKKGGLNVIVSSGYGTWGPPIRTGNTPEVVSISLNFNK